jgi:undecaprenyl diphosphate synthase
MKKIVPRHIAIIPDGNRRWARKNGLPSVLGHKHGVETFERICDEALAQGVDALTFYTFSSENWHRTKTEVRYLFRLLEDVFQKRLDKLQRQGIQLRVSGRIDEFPKRLQQVIRSAVDQTKENRKGIVHLCLNYGGRNEIIDAVQAIVREKVPASRINAKVISSHLDQPGLPEPDLIIRTSGEQRLSGFLLWQCEYSELYFSKKLWPDFTPNDFRKAIAEFVRRQRRYGA